MKKILIVEDEAVIRQALKRLLTNHDYQVDEADSVAAAKKFDLSTFNLVISDLRLPGEAGTSMIQLAGDTPVLIMTSYASMRSAIDSMKMGAVDYIAKPFDHEDMLETVARIIEQDDFEQTCVDNSTPSESFQGILGNCASMKQVFNHISKAAPTDCTVLIQGETGTGKELIAKAFHDKSSRSTQAMISVNCAAIPENLIESELFGYEKGAFTGANSDREGLIEAANKGTLFLDEIGELPLEAQARLLRFLQEGEIRRIGSVETRQVNVRVIAATHRDLKSLAKDGAFREDLFYRLNVMNIALPALRERGKDILLLAESILERRSQALKKDKMHFTPTAIQAITSYQWPGNIREMENVIERAVILSSSNSIDDQELDIDLELVNVENMSEKGNSSKKSSTLIDNDEEGLSIEDYFQKFIFQHQDSMSETELTQKLGISRKSLWERRKRLGIPRKSS